MEGKAHVLCKCEIKARRNGQGGIKMERPYIVCHMLSSLDGKIDGSFMSAPEAAAACRKYGSLRGFYACQATLYGTVTMEGSYAEGLAGELPQSETVYPKEDYIAASDVENYIVAVDPRGILGYSSKYIEKKNRPRAHVIEVLTEQVSPDYLAYLRKYDISYVFAGEEWLDCSLLLHKLKSLFGIDRLMIAGGGLMNWSFLQEDLIDELSLVVAPVTDGCRESASVFEKADFLPARPPAAFSLEEIQRIEDGGIWLRYLLKR